MSIILVLALMEVTFKRKMDLLLLLCINMQYFEKWRPSILLANWNGTKMMSLTNLF
jgi:hypothetical protein